MVLWPKGVWAVYIERTVQPLGDSGHLGSEQSTPVCHTTSKVDLRAWISTRIILYNQQVYNSSNQFRCEVLSHRECGHPCHLCHAASADFEMISTTTGSWIRPSRSRLWRCRIQLPVVIKIISKSAKVGQRWRGCPHSRSGTEYSYHETTSVVQQASEARGKVAMDEWLYSRDIVKAICVVCSMCHHSPWDMRDACLLVGAISWLRNSCRSSECTRSKMGWWRISACVTIQQNRRIESWNNQQFTWWNPRKFSMFSDAW